MFQGSLSFGIKFIGKNSSRMQKIQYNRGWTHFRILFSVSHIPPPANPKINHIYVLQPFKEKKFEKGLIKIKISSAHRPKIYTAVFTTINLCLVAYLNYNLFSLRYGYDIAVNYAWQKEVSILIFSNENLSHCLEFLIFKYFDCPSFLPICQQPPFPMSSDALFAAFQWFFFFVS